MSDVVLLQLTTSIFWFLVVIILVGAFKKEVGGLLMSMASFRIAGSSFEFKNMKETMHSQVILADTLLGLLSRDDRLDEIVRLVTSAEVEKLAKFAFKYTEEMEENKWNEGMLGNIAYLLLRFGRYEQAVNLCDALLERVPDHLRILNTKALALLTTRLDEKVKEAFSIFKGLVNRYPEEGFVQFNFALANSMLNYHEDAFKHMRILISTDYVISNPHILEDPLFYKTREERPDLQATLQEELHARLQN